MEMCCTRQSLLCNTTKSSIAGDRQFATLHEHEVLCPVCLVERVRVVQLAHPSGESPLVEFRLLENSKNRLTVDTSGKRRVVLVRLAAFSVPLCHAFTIICLFLMSLFMFSFTPVPPFKFWRPSLWVLLGLRVTLWAVFGQSGGQSSRKESSAAGTEKKVTPVIHAQKDGRICRRHRKGTKSTLTCITP